MNMKANEYFEKRKELEVLITIVSFAIFLYIAVHKLTNASLWFDEVIEYWYSKIMVGYLPYKDMTYKDMTQNMYERIISTFQPPLYNLIMFVWLQISDSELWFRLAGVVFGFVGMIGIYKGIYNVTESRITASITIVFCSFTYRLVYYWQECAEYCLVLASLMWMVYFMLEVIKRPSNKSIILFTVSSVIAVYSQYGAVFPAFGMLVSVLVFILLKKNKKLIWITVRTYGLAFIAAALPLYFLFFKKQLDLQFKVRERTTVISHGVLKASGRLAEYYHGLKAVFYWNFDKNLEKDSTLLFLIIFLILLFALICGSLFSRVLISSCFISWTVYFFAVETGLYSYGYFGNRYGIVFIPLWVVTFACCGFDLYLFWKKCFGVPGAVIIASIFVLLCSTWCVKGWREGISENWQKENNRDVVKMWIQNNSNETENTLIYYRTGPGFTFYMQEYGRAIDENKVTYLGYTGKTTAEASDSINKIYGEKWPDKLYILATHFSDDYLTLLDMFEMYGYRKSVIYDNMGQLIYLEN